MGRLGLCVLTFFCTLHSVSAQNRQQIDSTLNTLVLDTITVRYLDSDSIGKVSPAHLGDGHFIDVISKTGGVFKAHEQNYPLVVRGMVGSRVRIERNGQFMTGFDQTGYLADDINVRNVDGVRLVHGVRSVIYGSGGIGGVLIIEEGAINFKKSKEVYSNFNTNNNQQVLGLKIEEFNRRSGFKFSGQFKRANDFRYANGQEAENSDFYAGNVSLGYGFKTNKFHFEWRNSWHTSDWNRPRGFQNNSLELRDLHNRYRINSDVNFKFLFSKRLVLENRIWYKAYSIEQNRQNFASNFQTVNTTEDRIHDQKSYGIRSTLNGSLRDWEYKLGLDCYRLKFNESRTEENLRLGLPEVELGELTRLDQAGGIFGLIEKRKNRFQVLFSLRADFAKLGSTNDRNFFSKTTAGTELNYKISPLFVSTISLSRHFRYPETIESSGVFSGGRGIFIGNSEIDPETSYNIEVGLGGQKRSFSYNMNFWTSLMSNRIAEVLINSGEYTYDNIDKSQTIGFDYELAYELESNFDRSTFKAQISGSMIRGSKVEDFFGSGTPLIGIPPNRINLGFGYSRLVSTKIRLLLSVGAEHVGNFDRLPEEVVRSIWGVNEANAYLLINSGLSFVYKKASETITIGTKTLNLTDQSYFPFGTHIMGRGRDVRFFFKIDF